VTEAVEREEAARVARGGDEAQQPEQAEDAEGLQARRQKGRREHDDRDLERVTSEPAPPVRHDGEHDDDLGEEQKPDEPIGDGGEGPPRLAGVSLLDVEDRDDEQRGDDDRRFEAPIEPFGSLVHAGCFDAAALAPARLRLRNVPSRDGGRT
jgi:hypothetical protein